MQRVPPSTKTRQAIRELLESGVADEQDPRSTLMRLAMRFVAEEALEAKVRDLLGREYYERAQGEARGHRNGYRRGRLKTSEGEVSYASPQVRDADAEVLAELRGLLSGRSEGLEALAVEMFACGCSTRDIEAMFAAEDGGALLSRTAVSELTERLWEEYEAFATRDLSDVKPLYLFLDGLAERLTPGFKREAVLCAWAITWAVRKVLIHIAPGTKESTECCREFLEEMKRRGLGDPVLAVTDGAAGFIRAVEECFPNGLHQRCLAHKMRNIAAKRPEDIRAEFEGAARICSSRLLTRACACLTVSTYSSNTTCCAGCANVCVSSQRTYPCVQRLRPSRYTRTVTQQKGPKAPACFELDRLHVLARPGQIPHRFLLRPQHPHRRQLPRAMLARQRHRIAPVRLHPLARLARRRRRHHLAPMAGLNDLPVPPVPARTGLVAEAQHLAVRTQTPDQPHQRCTTGLDLRPVRRHLPARQRHRHRNPVLVYVQSDVCATLTLTRPPRCGTVSQGS